MDNPELSDEVVDASADGEPERVDRLVARIDALNNAVLIHNRNTEIKIAALNRADKRRKRSIRWAFATIAADLLVTSIGLFIWHAQADTNRKIQESLKATYVTQQQQAQTRSKVLCPLYAVLLSAALDPSRTAALSPQQKATLDANVRVIRDGYATLGCPTGPSATGSATH